MSPKMWKEVFKKESYPNFVKMICLGIPLSNQFPLKLSPDTEAHLEKFMSKENGAIGPQFRGNKLSDKDVFTSEAEVEIEMQEDLTKDLDSITSTEDKNNQDIIG